MGRAGIFFLTLERGTIMWKNGVFRSTDIKFQR